MSAALNNLDRTADRWVLAMISGGLIVILLSIVWGLFLNPRTLPNWAENVLVSVATACALKLGDCLATLIALASGRQVERMGAHLAESKPIDGGKVPEDAADAANQVADAADAEAQSIGEGHVR